MYTNEQKMKAVELYIKYNHRATQVSRELGYPHPNFIARWYKEYLQNGTFRTKYERQNKYTEEQKQYAIKEALNKEGVKDIDYMLYKLGEVETDKEGNIVDLDNKIKALKESNPTFFGTNDKPADGTPTGYQVVDNGLDEGKPSDPEATATADFEAALGL